jgi:hypothetical protein
MRYDLHQHHTPNRNRGTGFANEVEIRLARSWNRLLPTDWADQVETPLRFAHYSEYEIAAERTVGFDADDQPCFTAYRFMLTSTASDDDEEFYQVVTHSEEMAAWRLRDERWLVFRKAGTKHCNPPRGFYSFSQKMPR